MRILRSVMVFGFAICAISLMSVGASAQTVIGSVKTAWAIGGDHHIDIERIDDPKLPVSCYISHPITGGISGYFGVAKNHSLFSISCVAKPGENVNLSSIPNGESILSQRTSFFSKLMMVNRFVDVENKTVIYMVTAQNEMIDGSPFSSTSAVSFH